MFQPTYLALVCLMGLPAPVFGCYYPCGRTVTCALWQIQTYIYPFFNVGGGWGVHYDSTGLARLAVVFGIIILAAVILGRIFVWLGLPIWLIRGFDDAPAESIED